MTMENLKKLLPSMLIVMVVVLVINTGLPPAKALTADITAPENNTGDDSKPKNNKPKKKKPESKKKAAAYHGASTDLSQCADGTYIGTGKGYGGTIKVQVIIKDHKMTDITLMEAKADDPPYVAKAKGVISAILKAQSLEVDTISGATYSSNGIIMAVEDAISQAAGKGAAAEPEKKKASDKIKPDPDLDNQTYKDGTYYGTGTGFRGKVTARVMIKSGKMASVKVTKIQDDAPYMKKAKAVINRMINKQSTNVDGVAGATYSSNGIIEAVRDALRKAVIKKPVDDPKPPEETKPPEKENPEPGKYNDGVYAASARGYQGFITVSVTVSGEKITDVQITDANDDEPFLTNAKAVIEKIIKNQSADGIDAVSGATYSSEGILEAVQKALKKARKAESE